MSDLISREEHNAAVSDLNNEIRNLNKYINEAEARYMAEIMTDPHDPFRNPTEYHEYSDDYTEIFPLLNVPGYKMPLNPSYEEHCRLKKYYAIGGWCALLHFLFSTGIYFFLIPFIKKAVQHINPAADIFSINTYIRGSSILMSLNMLIFIIANVMIALLGLKLAKVKVSTLFKTRDFSFSNVIQYCLIAVFIWLVSRFAAVAAANVIEKFGYSVDVDTSGLGVTNLGAVISLFYACIIAPVTEEFFFRGMLLKLFSKANQRFAIFATAFLFGIGHGNLHQFVLGFLMGIFLAHITMKHCSIIPSILVHVFINSLVNIIACLDLNGTAEYKMMVIFEITAMVGAFMLLVFRIRDKLPQTTPYQVHRGAATARGSIGVLLGFIVPTVYAVYITYLNNM